MRKFLHMRKQGAGQLCGNCKADKHLYFHYTDSPIPLLAKSEISSFKPSVTVQVGLCQTSSETPKTGFLASLLK